MLAEAPNVRFEGWPRITVTVPEGIGARSERTITALEKNSQNPVLLGQIRHTRSTEADRSRLRFYRMRRGVQQNADGARLLSAGHSACSGRACTRGGGRRPHALSAGALGLPTGQRGSCKKNRPIGHSYPKENWPSAAMRVGLAAVDKMTPAQVTRGAMRAIIVAGFVLAVPVTFWTTTCASRRIMTNTS